jgi:hypothetical protein
MSYTHGVQGAGYAPISGSVIHINKRLGAWSARLARRVLFSILVPNWGRKGGSGAILLGNPGR